MTRFETPTKEYSPAQKRNVQISSGFECTHIPKNPTGGCLEATGHDTHFRADHQLLQEHGITIARLPGPWQNIEKQQGNYDWSWMDKYLQSCKDQGITPIMDLCHHTSFPDWTDFGQPDFPRHFAAFVDAFSQRYPEIEWYTLINEPTATAAICTNHWHPKNPDFHLMLKHMTQATCLATKILKGKNPHIKFFHTDPAEHRQTMDPNLQAEVDEFNTHDRFITWDLILGLIGPDHPRYQFLLDRGFTAEELRWIQQNPAQVDVMALDYYLHCERIIGDHQDGPPPARGISRVIMDYVHRYTYKFPKMQFALGEMNVRGSERNRLSWLKYGLIESEILQRALGDRYWGSAWYPMIDSFGWGNGSLITAFTDDPERDLDPTGIVPLNPYTLERLSDTESAQLFTAYARKEITALDMPDFTFNPNMHNYPGNRLRHRLERYTRVR